MIRRLWPFVLGSVALGLDAYVIAGLLPAIAASLGSRVATVGLGVATFTGAYALSGPILAGHGAGQHGGVGQPGRPGSRRIRVGDVRMGIAGSPARG